MGSDKSGGVMKRVFPEMSRVLRSADSFSKTVEDVQVRTASGGAVSMVALVIIAGLMVVETGRFLAGEERTVLGVDKSRDEVLDVHIDVDVFHINCELLGVDAHDSTGSHQIEITNGIVKRPIFPDGRPKGDARVQKAHALRRVVPATQQNYCGSCYGAAEGCCNNCTAVRDAYQVKGWLPPDSSDIEQCVREDIEGHVYRVGEGCNLKGILRVSKVSGDFYIAPGHTITRQGQYHHDLSVFRDHQLDVSHRIRELSFGPRFPNAVNPLDGRNATQGVLGIHEYFVKIVPTRYQAQWGAPVLTNQYSVQPYFRQSDPTKGGSFLPGIFFFYEMSPILVEVELRRRSFIHFLVQLCAIVGGVFSVLKLLDSSVYRGTQYIKKIQLGKSD
mmetsp:Transcript_13044/g.26447  ORF Transcript_13044/g.26447 Transcript_13044/m.26447 type:complete len:388 (+) Transcript_13044:93-1256(+)